MAQQDMRIPARAPATAPPPPRRFDAAQPEYLKPKQKPPRKPLTRKTIIKSQFRTMILMIIILVIFFIIYYLATVLVSNEYSGNMDEDMDEYSMEFSVPDVLSQDVDVKIEIDANEPVEIYIIPKEVFKEDMSSIELLNESINKNNRKTKNFVYEGIFEKGDYVIVTQAKNNNANIDINYKITRLVLMPILWLISLVFVIIILLCIIRIFLLEKKKSVVLTYNQDYPDYAQPRTSYATGDYPREGYYDDADDAYYGRSSQPRDPDLAYGNAAHDRTRAQHRAPTSQHYDTDGTPPRHSAYDRPPSKRQDMRAREQYDYDPPPRRGAPAPNKEYDRYDHDTAPYSRQYHGRPESDKPAEPTSKTPITVPCKCGEIIVVKDAARPIRILCPRCGRRGILEGKKRSEEENIFYQ